MVAALEVPLKRGIPAFRAFFLLCWKRALQVLSNIPLIFPFGVNFKMTESTFGGGKKALLGKDYEPPIYLD